MEPLKTGLGAKEEEGGRVLERLGGGGIFYRSEKVAKMLPLQKVMRTL